MALCWGSKKASGGEGFGLAQVDSEAVYAGRGRCYEDRGEISTGVGDFLADQGGQRAEGRQGERNKNQKKEQCKESRRSFRHFQCILM